MSQTNHVSDSSMRAEPLDSNNFELLEVELSDLELQLISQAAALVGQTPEEFILLAATQSAQETVQVHALRAHLNELSAKNKKP